MGPRQCLSLFSNTTGRTLRLCITPCCSCHKQSVSCGRPTRNPRDVVDLVTIHENILLLGAVICAAVGRFPGQSPEEMLSDITRHSRFTAEEFRVLATERPINVPDVHRRIRSMIEHAGQFVGRIPSDAVGFVFLEGGEPVQPDLEALEKYRRHAGASTVFFQGWRLARPLWYTNGRSCI